VTDGIESALAGASEAAGGGDVGIAGGAATINQYLAAGLVDELRLHVVPKVVGVGERILDGVGGLELEQVSARQTELVTHLVYRPARG
jgi:dihydrofolate reductase